MTRDGYYRDRLELSDIVKQLQARSMERDSNNQYLRVIKETTSPDFPCTMTHVD